MCQYLRKFSSVLIFIASEIFIKGIIISESKIYKIFIFYLLTFNFKKLSIIVNFLSIFSKAYK